MWISSSQFRQHFVPLADYSQLSQNRSPLRIRASVPHRKDPAQPPIRVSPAWLPGSTLQTDRALSLPSSSHQQEKSTGWLKHECTPQTGGAQPVGGMLRVKTWEKPKALRTVERYIDPTSFIEHRVNPLTVSTTIIGITGFGHDRIWSWLTIKPNSNWYIIK